MAFRRDSTSQLVFESKPASGSSGTVPDHFITRIVLDPNGTSIRSIDAFRAGVGNAFNIACQPSPLFKIRFTKFNLQTYVFGPTVVEYSGLKRSGKNFALTTEFVPPEVLAPFVDDYYEYDTSTLNVYSGDTRSLQTLPYLKPTPVTRRAPLFHYIYNPIVGQKMNLANSDWTIHAGYKEKRNGTALVLRTLDAAKDTAPVPPPVNDNANDQNLRMTSFATWQQESIGDFNRCYSVDNPGLSPQNYPTTTGTYSYCRGIQDIFNLRSRIFRLGAAAVRGERIILPAAWMEPRTLPPSSQLYEYNEEAIKMAVRAAQLQTVYKQFFRGEMLGQTDIYDSVSVWAWRVNIGDFNDCLHLVKEVGFADQEIYNNPPPVAPVAPSVRDAISRRHDVYEAPPIGTVYWLFSKGDVNDANFLLKLKGDQDPVTVYLRKKFSPTLQNLISAYNGPPPSDSLLQAVVDLLNPLLVDPLLPSEQCFAQVQKRPLTDTLKTRRPPGQILPPLNRMLIEDAYPQIVRKGPFQTSATIITDKIQHMIWRAPDLRCLYAFANVGNSSKKISFGYTRGVEGPGSWISARRDFSGDPAAHPGGIEVGSPESISFGQLKKDVTINARAIIAYQTSR